MKEMTYEPTVAYWLNQIDNASQEEKTWREEEAPAVLKSYKSEKQFNVLNSNSELLNSVLFNNLPRPVVNRRFPKKMTLNKKDADLAKYATEVLQSALSYEVDNDFTKKKQAIENAIQDYTLPGRGIMWVTYGATFIKNKDGEEEIKNQAINWKYINWQDFRQNPGRTEDDTWWIAKREWLDETEIKKVFGKEIIERCELNYMATSSGYEKITDEHEKEGIPDGVKRAEVWEVWDSKSKKRFFLTSSCEDFLRVNADPYELTSFFPMPEPLRYIKTNDSTVPTPEYNIYKKTATDLEDVCLRISNLTKKIRYRGLYANKWAEKVQALAKADDGTFLGVDIPPDLALKGGLNNVYIAEPIKEKSEVVMNLFANKQQLINDIYQITGIADIMRGGGDHRESASSVKLKSKFGSMRIKTRQEAVQEYIKSLTEITAELICEHYNIAKLKLITSIELPMAKDKTAAEAEFKSLLMQAQALKKEPPAPPPILQLPSWEEVVKFLRNEKLRGYAIDVETEFTAFDNEEEEKRSTNEFIVAMSGMMERGIQMVQQVPETAMLVKQLFMMGMKTYSIGRRVEDTVDATFDKIFQKAMQPKPPTPNVELIKATAAKTTADARMMEVQGGLQNAQAKLVSQNANNEKKLQSIVHNNALSHREKAMDLSIQKEIANIKQQAQNLNEQEFLLKVKELLAQVALKDKELEMQGNTNTNIRGDVPSFE